ncbi:small ribosomal subunit protein uS10-like [Lepeophtheirus salmonis]|uniref:small ribosomal subunit protein uS10-like n=1 Tax=Lepeophtheirus salmonis TaxID=72036 RepID=UPI003AF3C29A
MAAIETSYKDSELRGSNATIHRIRITLTCFKVSSLEKVFAELIRTSKKKELKDQQENHQSSLCLGNPRKITYIFIEPGIEIEVTFPDQ